MASTGHSTSNSVASTSSQAGSTLAPVCTCPLFCLHHLTAHGGRDTDELFGPVTDAGEIRQEGYMAAYANSNTTTVQAPPAPPPAATDEEETELSAHATVVWPDHQEEAWADQLLRGAN